MAIESCIRDIRQWMCEKKLLLKEDKTELLLVGSCKQLAKVSIDGVRVGDYNIYKSVAISPYLRHVARLLFEYGCKNYQDMHVQQCILLSLKYQTYYKILIQKQHLVSSSRLCY